MGIINLARLTVVFGPTQIPVLVAFCARMDIPGGGMPIGVALVFIDDRLIGKIPMDAAERMQRIQNSFCRVRPKPSGVLGVTPLDYAIQRRSHLFSIKFLDPIVIEHYKQTRFSASAFWRAL